MAALSSALSRTELTALADLYQRKEPLMAVPAPVPTPAHHGPRTVLDLDFELRVAMAVENIRLAIVAATASNYPVPAVVEAMPAHLTGWSELLTALETGR